MSAHTKMHGILFTEFKKFVEADLGPDKWSNIVPAESGRIYLPSHMYPDEELFELFDAASKAASVPRNALIERFGTAIVPSLLRIYRALLDPKWRTLELLEHADETIHRVVRLKAPSFRASKLAVSRLNGREVKVLYRSPRRLCAFARGIVRGMAKSYGETALIDEQTCMLQGDESCTIVVRVE